MSECGHGMWMASCRTLCGSLLAVTVAGGGAALGQTPVYTLTNLGKPAGADSVVGVRMNNLGHVAGWSSYPDPPDLRGWIWTPEGGFTILPIPPGMPSDRYRAMDVNDSGVVGGDGGFFSGLAWRYENNVYTIIGPVDGQTIAYLGGINNAGDISGTATDSDFLTPDLAFLDINGGALVNLTPGGGGRATDANNARQVAGYTQGPATAFEAFRWDEQSGIQLLGSLGLGYSFANAINEAGQVVGEALSLTGDVSMPWIYTDGAGMLQIPAPVTQNSVATGINILGHVVGTTEPLSPGPDLPWLWTGGGSVTDLNALFDAGAENFNALAAHDINDAGQILAFGFDNNAVEFRMVLLTPISEDQIPTVSEWGMIVMGLLILIAATLVIAHSRRVA